MQKYVTELMTNGEALQAITGTLLAWLVEQQNGAVGGNKKLVKEAVAVLAKIGFQEFIHFEVD